MNTNEEIEYKIALAEVDDVLKFTDKEIVDKIPQSFKDFIKQNKDTNYITNINPYLPINSQNIKDETKSIIALIYRSYIATEDEKKKFAEQDKITLEKYEEELKEKYSVENVFKKRKMKQQKETAIIVKEENGIWNKIKNFLKNIFKKSNGKY